MDHLWGYTMFFGDYWLGILLVCITAAAIGAIMLIRLNVQKSDDDLFHACFAWFLMTMVYCLFFVLLAFIWIVIPLFIVLSILILVSSTRIEVVPQTHSW